MPKGPYNHDLSFEISLDGKNHYEDVSVQDEELDHPVIGLTRVEETPPKHLLIDASILPAGFVRSKRATICCLIANPFWKMIPLG